MIGANVDRHIALTADMNQDGKLDLLAVGGCIWLGAGNATFTEAGCSPLGDASAGVGDFNGDGKLDTVLFDAALPLQLTIALGKGDGTYLNDFQFTLPAGVGSAAVGDFNNDGKLDVVTATGYLLLQTTVDLTPFSLVFGNQNVGTTSAAQTATLTNTGSQAVTSSSIAVSGAFSETNNCPSSLGIGGSCHIQVAFTPTAAGTATGTLSVTDNAAKSPQKVALGGTGTVITISPLAVNFGDQTVGTASTVAQITLTNSGASGLDRYDRPYGNKSWRL